jgi:hypothetical protein
MELVNGHRQGMVSHGWTYNDLPAREHDALVGPQSVGVDDLLSVLVDLDEVLHHGQALPAGNAALRRQRVEPAVHVEVLFTVGAITLDTESLCTEVANGSRRVGARLLRTSGHGGATSAPRGGERLQDALEVRTPRRAGLEVGEGELEVLESVVWVLFAVQLVLNVLDASLTRPAGTDGLDVGAVDEGVGALPVAADLARLLRELSIPPLRTLVVFESLVGGAQGLGLVEELVTPELNVPDQPERVDVETLTAAEDGTGCIVGVGELLRTVEPALVLEVPGVETQEGGSKEALDGVQEERFCSELVGLLVVLAEDLEKVGGTGELEDVLDVLGLVGNVVGALLVAEGICIMLVSMRGDLDIASKVE